MKLKILLASVLALVLAACGGPGANLNEAKKKEAAAATGRTFQALQATLLTQSQIKSQAVSAEPLVVACDTGSISYSFTTPTQTSFVYSIATPVSGCVEGNTTITTIGVGGFTMTYDFSNSSAFSVIFNGGISVKVGNETDTVVYNNFSFTISVNGNTYTMSLNGSVTANGETVIFNNESYTYADLGI